MSLQLFRLGPDGKTPLVVSVACPIDRHARCDVGFYGDIVTETFRSLPHATDVHVTMTHVTACVLVPDDEPDVDAYRSRLTSTLRSAIGSFSRQRQKERGPGQ